MENPYRADAPSLVLRDVVPSEPTGDASNPSAKANPAAMLEELASKHHGVGVGDALQALFPATNSAALNGAPAKEVASVGFTGRMDVIQLQEALENRCTVSGARSSGVCPVREGIYNDALNEIIRQVTVECPERGLLLALLRDEVLETNTTYEKLFDAACQYSVRKEIERDLKRTMATQLQQVSMETSILENRVGEVRAKLDGNERRFQERRAAEEKKHQEEVQFLKKGNQQLTNEIKRLTA